MSEPVQGTRPYRASRYTVSVQFLAEVLLFRLDVFQDLQRVFFDTADLLKPPSWATTCTLTEAGFRKSPSQMPAATIWATYFVKVHHRTLRSKGQETCANAAKTDPQ